MKILIQNGHVVDPLTGVDEVCDAVSYTHLDVYKRQVRDGLTAGFR